MVHRIARNTQVSTIQKVLLLLNEPIGTERVDIVSLQNYNLECLDAHHIFLWSLPATLLKGLSLQIEYDS